MTDTAALAHLVLPTTTLLEADDIVGAYGHHWLGVVRPVVEPPEGVKSDLEIIQGLAARVGLGEELAGSAREWKRRLMQPEAGREGGSRSSSSRRARSGTRSRRRSCSRDGSSRRRRAA